MNTYAATLSNPKWQRKRLEIFQRDLFRCSECHATDKALHVHHIRYTNGAKPWEYPDSNFVTLCCDCHDQKNPNKKFARKPHGQIVRERARTAFGNYPHRAEWPF